MALSAEGEWLDVRSAAAGTRSGVRVLRYHAAPLPETLPADVAAALRDRTRAVSGPATAELTLADVAGATGLARPTARRILLTLIELGDGVVVMSLRRSRVDAVADKLAAEWQGSGETLESMLATLREARAKYDAKKP